MGMSVLTLQFKEKRPRPVGAERAVYGDGPAKSGCSTPSLPKVGGLTARRSRRPGNACRSKGAH
jgi:hypothetical protein